jgi:hypothetical protein
MEYSTAFQRASINLFGGAARDILASGSHGVVLTSISNVIYLIDSDGELVWFTDEGHPMHRRGVQIRGVLPEIESDSNYRVRDASIEFEGGFWLDLNGYLTWKPERLRSGGLLLSCQLAQSCNAIVSSVQRLASPKGFARLLPAITLMVEAGSASPEFYSHSPVLNEAWPNIRGLFTAFSAQNNAQALHYASRLIGLGEGLTPSGDDFIGGILFALATLSGAYYELPIFKPHDMESFLAYARHSTNIISYSLLADHMNGHGSEKLHQFFNAFLTGESLDRIEYISSGLIAMGHSTGWDILAGVLTGMLLGVRENSALQVQVA